MNARSSRPIFKNSVYLAVSFATKVILYALLARKLARHDIGVLLYSLALLDLTLGISAFGVPQLAIREISSGQTDVRRFFSNLLCVRFGSAALVLAAVAVLVWEGLLLPPQEKISIILIIALAAIPKTLSECLDVFFAVSEQFIYPASLEILNHALFAAGCLLLLFYQFELTTIAVFYLAVACGIAALRVVILRGRSYFCWRDVRRGTCLRILRQLAPFGLLGLTMVFYLRIGDVLIVRLAPDGIGELAVFKMAHLPVLFLIGLLGASVTPFYGNITKLGGARSERGRRELSRTLGDTVRYLFMIGGLLVLAPTVFAEQLVALVCGPKWEAAAPLFKLMLWHAPVPAIAGVMARALQAVGRENRVAVAAAVILAIKVLLLVLLLPAYGALGLTAVTVGVSVLFLVVMSGVAWSMLSRAPGRHRMAVALCAFGAAVGLAWIGISGRPVVDVLLCYGCFVLLLGLSKAVTIRELSDLRKTLADVGRPLS